jgi:hypothetical protein
MSTAFYPQGMKSYNNYVNPGNYIPWKGTGVNSNPRGITATNIRPLTNNDPGNVFPTGFGLPRPIKHYRKGTIMPPEYITLPSTVQFNQISVRENLDINPASETILINYNIDRYVKSSKGASLGGGSGGTSLISQLIDRPGDFIVKANSTNTNINTGDGHSCGGDTFCETCCQGVGIVVDYSPNKNYLTNNPEPNTENPCFCCNEERKALRRVIPTSTNLSKKYYTTLQQYRQNRCQTYNQKVFNFATIGSNGKPGGPESTTNTYQANCQPNAEIDVAMEANIVNAMVETLFKNSVINQYQVNVFINSHITTFQGYLSFLNTLPSSSAQIGVDVYNNYLTTPYAGQAISGPTKPFQCKLVVYKPNNYQFAQQGAVSSSTRILKLNVDTIEKNLAGYNKDQRIGVGLGLSAALNSTGQPAIPFLYKNKAQGCNAEIQIRFQNHKSCNAKPAAPYQPARPSNHYQQSPVNPLL